VVEMSIRNSISVTFVISVDLINLQFNHFSVRYRKVLHVILLIRNLFMGGAIYVLLWGAEICGGQNS
jgi:hypothetical protein